MKLRNESLPEEFAIESLSTGVFNWAKIIQFYRTIVISIFGCDQGVLLDKDAEIARLRALLDN